MDKREWRNKFGIKSDVNFCQKFKLTHRKLVSEISSRTVPTLLFPSLHLAYRMVGFLPLFSRNLCDPHSSSVQELTLDSQKFAWEPEAKPQSP